MLSSGSCSALFFLLSFIHKLTLHTGRILLLLAGHIKDPWAVGNRTWVGKGSKAAFKNVIDILHRLQWLNKWPSAEKTGRGSPLNPSPSSPTHNPIGRGSEMNWAELKITYIVIGKHWHLLHRKEGPRCHCGYSSLNQARWPELPKGN